ncbi:MAG: hypothetical protein IKI84_11085 [Clostridia bacterium]|nr:hypothetical protein [Clostridia bacterium]
MNFIEKTLVRKVLKPQLTSNRDGHCELRFASFPLIKQHAGNQLHYLADVMAYLPGVESSEIDETTGSLSIRYDNSRTDVKRILKWFDSAVESGIKASDDVDFKSAPPDKIVAAIKKYLLPTASEY